MTRVPKAKKPKPTCPMCGQTINDRYSYKSYECNCGWEWVIPGEEDPGEYTLERVQKAQDAWVPLDQRPPAVDYLGYPIHVGSFVCYPTGGQSARLVLAKVTAIEPYVKGHNGLVGDTVWRLVVQRLQEGKRKNVEKVYQWADGHEYRTWEVDPTKEVRVDQLHRVLVVNPQHVQEPGEEVVEIDREWGA